MSAIPNFSYLDGIKAIADGQLVALRINDNYIQDDEEAKYSNGFIFKVVEEGEKVIHDILDDYKIRTPLLNHGYQGEKYFDEWWNKLPEEPKRKGSPIVAFTDTKFNIFEENPISYA